MRKKPLGDARSGFSAVRSGLRRRRAVRRERWGRRVGRLRAAGRGAATAGLVVYLVALGYLTLGRFHQVNPGYNLRPGRTIAHDLAVGGVELAINLVGNVAATLPLGALLPVVLPRWVGSAARATLVACAVSLLIEWAQKALGSRVADVDDVILNTLGGWLGYGLGVAWRRWFRMHSGSRTPAVSP